MDYNLLELLLRKSKKRSVIRKCLTLVNIVLISGICNVSASPIVTELQQQTRKVIGTVLSQEDNEPIAGANVLVEGTSVGVITDIDGKFSIPNVPADAKTIKFSYVGMSTQTLPIQSEMTVLLESDIKLMDEVIVVAYGTAKKSSFTGAANQI
jgi:hypothetical protein